MSQPKRFEVQLHEMGASIFQHYAGRFVEYSDYAALAAQNERLRSKLSFSQSIREICKQTQEGETIKVKGAISSGKTDLSSLCQCERLAAENERLRQALTYAMSTMDINGIHDNGDVEMHERALGLGRAALNHKEGRDAK